MPIPNDRCQRCTGQLAEHGGEQWRAGFGDRVCRRCAATARKRGDRDIHRVNAAGERVCDVCGGEPLPPTDGPARMPILRVCGVCTPLPESVRSELADGT